MKIDSVEVETTQGDELGGSDLKSATWKVVEAFVDIDEQGEFVLTLRVEVHSLDMLTPNITPQQVYDWTQEDSGVKDEDPPQEGEEGGDE